MDIYLYIHICATNKERNSSELELWAPSFGLYSLTVFVFGVHYFSVLGGFTILVFWGFTVLVFWCSLF